jgi:putative glutamine amidotransferase
MNFMKLGQFEQFHIRDKYIDAVYDNGGLPLPLPCIPDADAIRQYLLQVQGLIIIGGMDYPPELYGQSPHPMAELMDQRRVLTDILLFKTAMELELPILGICAGMQLMNIVTGGQLIQHLQNVPLHQGETYHSIKIQNSRWLSKIFPTEQIIVNSNHHQGIDPAHIGAGFTPVARAEDGQIEAVEYDCKQMVLGIQWHPERISNSAENARVFAADADLVKQIDSHRDTVFGYFITYAKNKYIPY